ncbi:protein of unknown function [Albimonas donghaensis]|uniref:DUF4326 domain-containing protein n=1 Tax=Albimonas donghaensis TaxID=356660 RepID=A0A1H3FES8_9RHOB|nr:DUF4326 domain-containing protein [Albimonas donghaensis]SDX89466.1 protein of unknown function [Albimonas donghaensis]
MTAPARIQRRRVRGWRMPEGAAYVGRPTLFGNPWAAGDPATVDVWFRGDYPAFVAGAFFRGPRDAQTREWAVECFRAWLEDDAPALPDNLTDQGQADAIMGFQHRRAMLLDRLPEIRGRALACWCPLDCSCHADVLLELANR